MKTNQALRNYHLTCTWLADILNPTMGFVTLAWSLIWRLETNAERTQTRHEDIMIYVNSYALGTCSYVFEHIGHLCVCVFHASVKVFQMFACCVSTTDAYCFCSTHAILKMSSVGLCPGVLRFSKQSDPACSRHVHDCKRSVFLNA